MFHESHFYEAINYANLILETADRALETDPDFTEGDLAVVKGEMYAMRALCHFYLVRTFRDIPLATHSAKNDAEIPEYFSFNLPGDTLAAPCLSGWKLRTKMGNEKHPFSMQF